MYFSVIVIFLLSNKQIVPSEDTDSGKRCWVWGDSDISEADLSKPGQIQSKLETFWFLLLLFFEFG